jgi:deoxyribonuclease (pyrimidine dimer)
MTRINVGVQPQELCDAHLLAEMREMLRVPNKVKSGRYRLDIPLPSKFTLGSGHERFFIDKLQYLHKRYLSLREDALNRGFNCQDFSTSFENLPKELYNDYEERVEDRDTILERINERLRNMKRVRFTVK